MQLLFLVLFSVKTCSSLYNPMFDPFEHLASFSASSSFSQAPSFALQILTLFLQILIPSATNPAALSVVNPIYAPCKS